MKKMKKNLMVLLAGLLLFPVNVHAQWIRPNHFVNQKGAQRVAEIKRFQAQNNLVVTGGLNKETKNMLYNQDLRARDVVKNPPSQGYWIVVNKTRLFLTLYKGDKVAGKYPVCLGTSRTSTPSGKGKIQNRQINPAWGGMNGKYKPIGANDPRNPLGERWMGLNLPGKSGYGIHGTIKPHQIGTYSSNGCIRMYNYDIENFVYPRMTLGAPVWIGTDAELANMGILQVIEKGASQAQNQESPVEKEVSPKAMSLY